MNAYSIPLFFKNPTWTLDVRFALYQGILSWSNEMVANTLSLTSDCSKVLETFGQWHWLQFVAFWRYSFTPKCKTKGAIWWNVWEIWAPNVVGIGTGFLLQKRMLGDCGAPRCGYCKYSKCKGISCPSLYTVCEFTNKNTKKNKKSAMFCIVCDTQVDTRHVLWWATMWLDQWHCTKITNFYTPSKNSITVSACASGLPETSM